MRAYCNRNERMSAKTIYPSRDDLTWRVDDDLERLAVLPEELVRVDVDVPLPQVHLCLRDAHIGIRHITCTGTGTGLRKRVLVCMHAYTYTGMHAYMQCVAVPTQISGYRSTHNGKGFTPARF